jgi:hypothetical protein
MRAFARELAAANAIVRKNILVGTTCEIGYYRDGLGSLNKGTSA